MQCEIVQSRGAVDEWRVEAIDFEDEGQAYVTIFSGPDAQHRAEEYAAWKYDAVRQELVGAASR